MSWDYRSLCSWINWTEEGQGNEGGNNQYDNCVPAGTLLCLEMLYKADKMEPQDVTNAVYGSNYHGVEDSGRVISYCQGRSDLWSNFPSWSGNNPGDPASWIEANGSAHKPMLYFVRCNSSAQIVANGAYGHCAVPIAGDGSNITLWANGFYGGVVTLSHAQINAVDFGGSVLFDRAISGDTQVTDDQLRAVIALFFDYYTGGPPAGGGPDLDAWLNHTKSVNSLDDTRIQIAQGKAAPGNAHSDPAQLNNLNNRVTALENKPAATSSSSTSYDDSAIKNRVAVVESDLQNIKNAIK